MPERQPIGAHSSCCRHDRTGAYGLTISGIDDARHLVDLADGPCWPEVTVGYSESSNPCENFLNHDIAQVLLANGECARLERIERRGTLLTMRPPDDGRMIHPFLSAVGATFAWWDGREAFHGGAFVHEGGAWLVLGDNGSGKSALLAHLALSDVPVLADDLVVVADGNVHAGPRCVDLRESARDALALEGRTTAVRGDARFRLTLPAVQPTTPLRGFIFLRWADTAGVRALPPTERFPRLAAARAVSIHSPWPQLLIDLASIPALELSRPQDWSARARTADLLFDAVAEACEPR